MRQTCRAGTKVGVSDPAAQWGYERLLMPFSEGAGVNRIIASLKTISDDGSFEIRNLMRANDVLPIYLFKSVIDQNLFHKMPGRIMPGDVIEFS